MSAPAATAARASATRVNPQILTFTLIGKPRAPTVTYVRVWPQRFSDGEPGIRCRFYGGLILFVLCPGITRPRPSPRWIFRKTDDRLGCAAFGSFTKTNRNPKTNPEGKNALPHPGLPGTQRIHPPATQSGAGAGFRPPFRSGSLPALPPVCRSSHRRCNRKSECRVARGDDAAGG